MMTRKIPTVAALLLLLAQGASAASIANVKAQQRPKSDIVDVYYDLIESGGGVFDISLSIEGGGDKPTLSTLSGDVGVDIVPGRNKHIVWDAGTDWPNHLQSNFVATVTASPDYGMVLIPGGTNTGSNPDTDMGSYSLSVESFYMDRTEVKYMRWKFVYDWAVEHGYQFDNAGGGKALDNPVQKVNWYDCIKWCNARSEMDEREPVYRVGEEVYRTGIAEPTVDMDCDGYRLPTSDEWEYAARGGFSNHRFPWGELVSYKPGLISHERANYACMNGTDDHEAITYYFNESSPNRYHPLYSTGAYPYTAPVASFPMNGYGLYDMIGNVREWTGTASGSSKILRGGTWSSTGRQCRIGMQQTAAPDTTNYSTGFRTVRNPKPKAKVSEEEEEP